MHMVVGHCYRVCALPGAAIFVYVSELQVTALWVYDCSQLAVLLVQQGNPARAQELLQGRIPTQQGDWRVFI
jgi:hypothetical protein